MKQQKGIKKGRGQGSRPVKNIENHREAMDIVAWGIRIYVVAVLAGMLLVFHDFYFDILETKFYYYAACTITMIVVLGSCLLIFWGCPSGKRGEKKERFSAFKAFSWTDGMVLVWGAVILISTVLSPERKNSFWGLEGRYVGCFLLLLYVVAYFFITRYYHLRKTDLLIFLAAGLFMCLFGISDFFDMDLLHFKREIKQAQRFMFTSTIGNINTYTSCVAMVMAVAGVLFAAEKEFRKVLGYGVCVCISFTALILGESDNAYLSLAAFFGFLPFYLFRSPRGAKRYAVLIAMFFTVMKGIMAVQLLMGDKVVPINGLFQVIADSGCLPWAIAALWLAVGVIYFADFKCGMRSETISEQPDQAESMQAMPWLVRGWTVFFAVVLVAVIYVLYDVNGAGNGARYGMLQGYLQFGDDWGTHRGYIWRIALENYHKFPVLQKIFGYGPDTFGIITKANNYPEMVERYSEIFDSAHNEYLQYFVTIGPLGLLAYLGIHVAAAVHVFKKKLDNPCVMAAFFAVLCYGFQALVNINQPIAGPVMWTLLAAAMAGK